MKCLKIISIFCLIILAVLSVHAADSAKVSAALVRTEPFPLTIGEDADIFFKVTNTGNTPLANVIVEYTPEFPFTVRDTEQIKWTIKELAAGDDHRFSFKLSVDGRATRGQEELTFRISQKDLSFDDEITVTIREEEQALEIKEVLMTPSSLAPGSQGQLAVVFKNNAESYIRDLDISINIEGDVILPIGSTSKKRIDILSSGSEYPVMFNVKALETAAASTYKLTINWTYQDEAGTSYSDSEVSSLTIGGQPVLDVVLDETDILRSGRLGRATISILNKGLIDAKFVTVRIGDSSQFTLLDPEETYVGDIQSDDFENVEYQVFFESEVKEIGNIPVAIEYYSPEGEKFTLQKNIGIPIYSDQQISQLGLEPQSNTGMIVFLVVIIIVLILGYRWWKKKKHHH